MPAYSDIVKTQPSEMVYVSLNKTQLDTLPTEILCTIFEYLTIDTAKYAYPRHLDQIVMQNVGTEESCINKVSKKHFMPLMLVNHFFHEFVNSIIFTNHYTGKDITRCAKGGSLWTSKTPFVFQSTAVETSYTKLPRTFYEIPDSLNEVLPLTKRLWLGNGLFDYSSLLGNQWHEGIVDSTIQHLVYLVIDMVLLDDYYQYNLFLKIPESVEDRKDLPPQVIDRLKSSSTPIDKKVQIYNRQLLFNGLAKLVSNQKDKVTCKIISHYRTLFELSCLLWAFRKEQVLESVVTLDVKHSKHDEFTKEFANELEKMTSLKKLSFISKHKYNNLLESDIEFLLSAIANLKYLQQLEVDVPEPQKVSCFFHGLHTLSASNNFLSGKNLIPLNKYLNDVVQMTWDFQTSMISEEITPSQNMEVYRLENLKTLTLRGSVVGNNEIMRVFFDMNPQITTLSIEVDPQEFYFFNEMLKEMRNLEFLNLRYLHSASYQPNGYQITVIFTHILCRKLANLKVFSINARSGQINLQTLINDIAYNCAKFTKSLDKIYIYGHIDRSKKNKDPLTLFFTTNASEAAAIITKTFSHGGVVLSDFVNYLYLSPQTNALECEYNVRLEIDVKRLKNILNSKRAVR
jgi:hypothetical protein